MQLRLRSKNDRKLLNGSILVKSFLIILVLFLAVFLLDKIKMPMPNKFIKQELSNDKLITVK